jgi:hypothetical protein
MGDCVMILNAMGRFSTSFQGAGGSEPSFGFSAASQYVMQVFVAEKTMTITQFGMCVNSSSGTPPIRIAMWQYVSGQTPNPSTKTYTDANTITTTAGISTPTFVWWNLTTPQTITKGSSYAIGLESFGTWSGGLSVVQGQQQQKRDYSQISGLPYGYTSSSGSTLSFRWGIASATETYGYPVSTSSTVNVVVPFNGNDGFAGNSFIVPTSMGGSCKLQGVIAPIAANNAFQTSALRLYNATSYPPTLITSKALGTGGNPSAAIPWYQGQQGMMYIPFNAEQTLTTGVKYLIGFQSSGDAFQTGKITFVRGQDGDSLSDVTMFGVEGDFVTNTWTESGLFRYAISPDVTTFTQSVGSSGGGPIVGGRLIN